MCAATVLTTSLADGGFTSYATRSEFSAANPGLPTEDFEGGAVRSNGIGFMESRFNSSKTNRVFSAGDILPGIEFSSTKNAPSMSGFDLFVIGAHTIRPPTTSKVLGQTYFGQSLNLDFNPSVLAVGLDVSVAGAGATPTTLCASVFGARGLLGEFELIVGLPDEPTFFGLASDVPMVRLNLADMNGQDAEIVDNIAFGIPFRVTVPEPSGLSMIVLACLGWGACPWPPRLRRKKSSLHSREQSLYNGKWVKVR